MDVLRAIIYFVTGSALLLTALSVLRAQLRRNEPEFCFAMALVLLPNLTTTTAAFTPSRTVYADAFFQRDVSYVGLGGMANMVATPLLIVVALLLAFSRLRNARVNFPHILFAITLLIGAVAATDTGPFLYGGRAALIVVAILAALMRPGDEAVRGAAVAVTFLAGLAAMAAVITPEYSLESCGSRKCGALGSLLVGIADNPNSMGLLLACSVPVAYIGLPKYQLAASTSIVLLTATTGSRTAEIAAAATLVAIISLRMSPSIGRLVTYGIVSTGATVMILLPSLHLLDPRALTDRVGLWDYALTLWSEDPWIGLGPDRWRNLSGAGGFILRSGGYSTHNQFVEVLFVAGVVGLLLFVVTLWLAYRSHPSNDRARLLLLIAPIVLVGIAERPISLGQIDGLSWTLIVVLLYAGTQTTADLGKRPRSLGELAPVSGATRLAAHRSLGSAGH